MDINTAMAFLKSGGSLLEAVLAIETPVEWKQELTSKYHAKIAILDCLPYQDDGNRDLVEIEVEEQYVDMVLEDVKKNPEVDLVDLMVVDRGRIKGAVATNECVACCSMVGTDAFLLDSNVNKEGKTVWRLLATDKQSIRQVITDLEDHRYNVELMKLTSVDVDELMTSRQEDILQIAFERGYFDYPKRISLRDLAAMFDISISTLSEMLRKGQRKIMEEYFVEET
jgi:predicted DNA binding protein